MMIHAEIHAEIHANATKTMPPKVVEAQAAFLPAWIDAPTAGRYMHDQLKVVSCMYLPFTGEARDPCEIHARSKKPTLTNSEETMTADITHEIGMLHIIADRRRARSICGPVCGMAVVSCKNPQSAVGVGGRSAWPAAAWLRAA